MSQRRPPHYWRDRQRRYRGEHSKRVRLADHAAWHRNKVKYLARQRALRAVAKLRRAAARIVRRNPDAAALLRSLAKSLLN